ncbi:uncharacterized protein LOC110719113 [Chenopodium quinoa]|uniref:uncharacterized protein LOC110719113 n=1 Tax=Chenopodium quinoa TaxID=63459 RepID=UPI000B7868BD|nr:uncharacterized protein LOC110719113 [Chenopodium quinoa]XP_021753705.1 uncharacterized protein LOC110719113 [Chenopodium quinoa]XP_021753706.1 uncharacterized protein LOC110719113 [Chenopodium quinoa]XP_021753707.1 uncharacterized protein LOC110719113 [Chenopodium quinoa]
MVDSTDPPDPSMSSDQEMNDLDQKSPSPVVSFREVVASSSQWFEEARRIIATSTEWSQDEDIGPVSGLTVRFDKDTLDRLRKPWGLTLMGKCLGTSIRPAFMLNRARIMWKIKGGLEVIDLGHNVFLFRFTMEDDYERALFGGPWFVFDHYLMMAKWRPNFRASENPFDKMNVWIRFTELPVEYYDKSALFEIAKLAGTPIRVDYATDRLTRGRYARVCIEIDLSKPLVTKVWIGGAWQHISYENITSLCFTCGKVGHVQSQCMLNKKHEVEVKGTGVDQNASSEEQMKLDSSANEVNGPQPDIIKATKPTSLVGSPSKSNSFQVLAENDVHGEFGPWTLVTNKKKHFKSVDNNNRRSVTKNNAHNKVDNNNQKSVKQIIVDNSNKRKILII